MWKENIYQAPFQGITDCVYRNTHAELFGGISKFFTPYAKLENSGEIKKSIKKDIVRENQSDIPVVLQVLCNTNEELHFWIEFAKSNYYKELNINMGCPYPMVTNRGKGSGLIVLPDVFKGLMDVVSEENELQISVKMRLGLNAVDQWKDISEAINQSNLSEVIIHPRIAKQLYKGDIQLDAYKQFADSIQANLIINGDIFSEEDVQHYANYNSSFIGVMLGRSLLQNPLLAHKMRGETVSSGQLKEAIFEFQNSLLSKYLNETLDIHHILNKLKSHWEYWSLNFQNPGKTFKPIKKSKNLDEYKMKLPQVLNQEMI